MDVAVITMGKIGSKFPRFEHCCYGLSSKKRFPVEAILFYSTLIQKKIKAKFFDGNLISESEILTKIRRKPPKKIIYYLYTPRIKSKKAFLEKLGKISELYLVASPFYWKEKILKEFPFVKDVFYDGEKGMGIDVKDTQIDYDKFNINEYLDQKEFPVIFSKYCPYQCTFCNAQKTGLMQRNLDIVKKELEYLKKKGVKRINLCGNNLTINKENFFKICEIMKNLNLEWIGDGRVNHITEDMYKPLKESKGMILFGIESASQKILNKMKKQIKIKQIIKIAEELKKRDIPFIYSFMFGLPWDSFKSFKEIVRLRKILGASNYHCIFLDAFPGTPLFEEIKRLNLINENELDYIDFDWSMLPLSKTLYLSKEQVKELVKKIMIKGILDKKFIYNIIRTKKIRDYPKVLSRGLKLLITGRRVWNE